MSDALQQAKLRGDEARRLMEDDGIVAFAIREMKKQYINEWTQTQQFETQKRESTYTKLNMVGDFEATMRQIIGNGKLAEQQIIALQQRQKR